MHREAHKRGAFDQVSQLPEEGAFYLDNRVMTVRKLFKKLHLWLSLPFGLIIMTTCLTGALLFFEKEITALVQHESVASVPDQEPLPLSVLLERVAEKTPDSVEITSITIPTSPHRAYNVGLSKPRQGCSSILIRGRSSGRVDASPSSLRYASYIAGCSIA